MFDDKIILTGIDPSSSVHALIQYELAQLLDEAPSDASIKFRFTNEPEGSVGIVKIYSQQRKFVASFGELAAKPHDVCMKACKDLREQLTSWKATRFLPAS